MKKSIILYRNVKIPLEMKSGEYHDRCAVERVEKIYNRTLKNKIGKASFSVYKKSVDARHKDAIVFIYTICVIPDNMPSQEIFSCLKNEGFELIFTEEPNFNSLNRIPKAERPVVAGFGPAGIFCAYALAKAGLCPVVLERGADVDERTEKVNDYWNNAKLDSESNVQFGEGGAGAFSDGKLLTRISDSFCSFVLKTLCKHGAPQEIMYLSKPHVGTDLLKPVVKSIREEIIALGAKVLFNSKLTGINYDSSSKVCSVEVNNSFTLECSALFLCIGHSARDTFNMLEKKDVLITPKAFSVGVRVEHLQKDIEEALYGEYAFCEALPRAQYTLSAKDTQGRGVYSFCMCPGGRVVASASEQGEIVTNGMSLHSRSGKNANSAIAVSISPKDYGNTPKSAIDFQKMLETRAYKLAGGNSKAPVELLGDFLNDKKKDLTFPSDIMPSYTGDTSLCCISDIFPDFVNKALKSGFNQFEKRIAGFSSYKAVLTAPETRTSSPVRIDREKPFFSVRCENLYPCGEGAGYAGGITSAAVDGLRSALSYIENVKSRYLL